MNLKALREEFSQPSWTKIYLSVDEFWGLSLLAMWMICCGMEEDPCLYEIRALAIAFAFFSWCFMVPFRSVLDEEGSTAHQDLSNRDAHKIWFRTVIDSYGLVIFLFFNGSRPVLRCVRYILRWISKPVVAFPWITRFQLLVGVFWTAKDSLVAMWKALGRKDSLPAVPPVDPHFEALQQEHARLEEENAQLRERASEAQEKASALEGEIARLKYSRRPDPPGYRHSRQVMAQDLLERSKQRVHYLEGENSQLRKENRDMAGVIREKDETIDDFPNELALHNQSLKLEQNQVAKLSQELADANDEIDDLVGELAGVKHVRDHLKKKYTSLERVSDSHEARARALQTHLDNFRSPAGFQTIESAESSAHAPTTDSSAERESSTSLQAKLEEAEMKATSAQTSETEEKQRAEKAIQERDEARQQVEMSQEEGKATNQKLENTHTELTTIQTELKTTQTKLKDAQEKITAIEKKATADEEKATAAEAKATVDAHEGTVAEKKLEETQAKLEDAHQQTTLLSQKLKTTQNKMQTAHQKALEQKAIEYGSLQARFETSEAKVALLEKNKNEFNDLVSSLEKKKTFLAEQDAVTPQISHRSDKTMLIQSHNKIKDLTKERDESHHERDRLQTQFNTSQGNFHLAEKCRQEAVNAWKNCNNALVMANDEIAVLKEHNRVGNQELQRCKSLIEQYQQRGDSSTAQILDEAQEFSDRKLAEILQLQEKLKNGEKQYNDVKATAKAKLKAKEDELKAEKAARERAEQEVVDVVKRERATKTAAQQALREQERRFSARNEPVAQKKAAMDSKDRLIEQLRKKVQEKDTENQDLREQFEEHKYGPPELPTSDKPRPPTTAQLLLEERLRSECDRRAYQKQIEDQGKRNIGVLASTALLRTNKELEEEKKQKAEELEAASRQIDQLRTQGANFAELQQQTSEQIQAVQDQRSHAEEQMQALEQDKKRMDDQVQTLQDMMSMYREARQDSEAGESSSRKRVAEVEEEKSETAKKMKEKQ